MWLSHICRVMNRVESSAHRVRVSGGFKVGGPKARLKRGALSWHHRTQPTVISTFDQTWDMATEGYVPEITVAVRDHFESSILAHYNCCFVEAPVKARCLHIRVAVVVSFQSRVLTHFIGCWGGPFEIRLPSNWSCCWRHLWKWNTCTFKFL